MDINLPLILFIAVFGTGVVWLIDIFFYAGKRKTAISGVEAQFEGLSEDEKNKDKKYQEAIEIVSQEPQIIEYSKSFFPVLLLVFVLRSFVIEPFQIPSESMVPTLEVGDFILVNKFKYGIRLPLVRTKVIDISDPKRGDVMVFFPPHESRYFIKRVIGLPLDRIRIVDNTVYVNGEKLDQVFAYTDNRLGDSCYGDTERLRYIVSHEKLNDKTHLMRKCESPYRPQSDRTWEVPAGHYFMMGDNRDNSSDSRVWGPVPEQRIVGKAFAIWMHWESFLSIPTFSRVGKI